MRCFNGLVTFEAHCQSNKIFRKSPVKNPKHESVWVDWRSNINLSSTRTTMVSSQLPNWRDSFANRHTVLEWILSRWFIFSFFANIIVLLVITACCILQWIHVVKHIIDFCSCESWLALLEWIHTLDVNFQLTKIRSCSCECESQKRSIVFHVTALHSEQEFSEIFSTTLHHV